MAVVGEEFARRFFPGEDALGKRFRDGPSAPWVTVVGIVAALRRDGSDADRAPQVYFAAAQTSLYPVPLGDVAVRGAGDAEGLVALVRDEVRALDPEQPIRGSPRSRTRSRALSRRAASASRCSAGSRPSPSC